MRRSRFFKPGERIGVAVSGGPDSMLLLDFAVVYALEAGLALSVVHFNHHLRGAESDGDETFVRTRAQQLGLEFLCSGAEVARIARAKKRNLEAVARDLRYGFFMSLVRQGKLDKVATAHTANDQAETVLLRLIRGAGTRGLGGIHQVLEGGVVRPFLMVTRAEVEAEIARRGVAYRVDATNRQTQFARNRLRERVLPLLEGDFNARVVESLAGFADRARDDEAFLEEQARERARAWLGREDDGLRIPAQRLREFPRAIAWRVLRQMIAEAAYGPERAPGPVAIRHTEMEDLLRLANEGRSGSRLLLGAGVEARREFDWLAIGRVHPEANKSLTGHAPGFSCVIEPPAGVIISGLALRLIFSFDAGKGADPPEGEYTKCEGVWLDSVNLAFPLTLRSWRAGDRFHSAANTRPVKLKELFQRRRIPVAERAWWPVLESSGKIIWVRGFGAAYRSGPGSGKRLLISERRVPGSERATGGSVAPPAKR